MLELPWSTNRDRTWPQGNHQVLFPDIAQGMVKGDPNLRVVAFFRQPEDRLLSAYFHMRDLMGPGVPPPRNGLAACCDADWGWPASVFRDVHKGVRRGVAPEPLVGHFHGCQTSMVLGKGCMSGYASSPSHVASAIALVDKFTFVGDMAHWNLSLCLFNKLVTGRRFTLSYQLLNSRPTKSKRLPSQPWLPTDRPPTAEERHQADARAADASRLNSTDPIDGALYAFARYRFWHDVAQHQISSACCPNFEDVHQIPNTSEVSAACSSEGARKRARHRAADAARAAAASAASASSNVARAAALRAVAAAHRTRGGRGSRLGGRGARLRWGEASRGAASG